jgi:hypothetical protein
MAFYRGAPARLTLQRPPDRISAQRLAETRHNNLMCGRWDGSYFHVPKPKREGLRVSPEENQLRHAVERRTDRPQ